eukprot:6213270-Pleurochrysis_carterae.AAC.2
MRSVLEGITEAAAASVGWLVSSSDWCVVDASVADSNPFSAWPVDTIPSREVCWHKPRALHEAVAGMLQVASLKIALAGGFGSPATISRGLDPLVLLGPCLACVTAFVRVCSVSLAHAPRLASTTYHHQTSERPILPEVCAVLRSWRP